MNLKLTENQIQFIMQHLSKNQIIDFLSEDVEKSIDWICDFIKQYVDSETLQNKIKNSFPPIQLEIFDY